MRDFLILDCPEIQCPKVLVIVFREFCGAFERKGFSVRVIHSISEIIDNSVVFMGDFVKVPNACELLAQQSVSAIYIGWYWHQQKVHGLPYFIHVYENIVYEDKLPEDRQNIMRHMKSRINSCPFLLRANEDPEKIGKFPRHDIYDYCYMGGRIRAHLVPRKELFKGIYHGTHKVEEYFPYPLRRDFYLSSTFALGFQTDDNFIYGHVSQRVYEGMAYGCIVLANSEAAEEQTDGIVECFRGRDKLEERMRYYLDHPEEMKEKQERGYAFVREQGTNEHSTRILQDKILTVYGIDILER